MSVENKSQEIVEIHRHDLPLCCPPQDTPIWNSHPRVFLKIEKSPQQEIICPYCSIQYKLVK